MNGPAAKVRSNRVDRLMRSSILAMDLDLTGIGVLTEAASDVFSTTCLMAAIAGASPVVAVARDSEWGDAKSVVEDIQIAAKQLGIDGHVQFETELSPRIVRQCSLVTNLGFVRPIDARMMSELPRDSAISLMCEPWEMRQSDVDVDAAVHRSVAVAGTNERHPLVRTFDYLGPLAGLLMLKAQKEVVGSEVLLVASEPFAEPIADWLVSAGADRVDIRVPPIVSLDLQDSEASLDAVLVAHMGRDSLGSGMSLSPSVLARLGTALLVIAGDVETKPFERMGVEVHPLPSKPTGHMWVTTSMIGPKPVINLHCAGLKVGEVMVRALRSGLSPKEAECQAVDSGFGLPC